MSTGQFEIEYRKSRGNLHVYPRGHLNEESVQKLLEVIHSQYDGQGLVFIDTNHLGGHDPVSINTFKTLIESSHTIPPARVVLKGAKGLDFAPEGSRVLIAHGKGRCAGNGNCARYACHSGQCEKESSGSSSGEASADTHVGRT